MAGCGETEGPEDQAQTVTMTTLLGAPTRHHHPENQTQPEGGEGCEQRCEQNELTLMKVKMSVVLPDNHTQTAYEMSPGFTLFTVLMKVLGNCCKCKCLRTGS